MKLPTGGGSYTRDGKGKLKQTEKPAKVTPRNIAPEELELDADKSADKSANKEA